MIKGAIIEPNLAIMELKHLIYFKRLELKLKY